MDIRWVAVLWGIGSVCTLLGFVAYLRFLAFIVKRTGDTKGLRDAAVAARAFPLARSMRLAVRPRHREPPELETGPEEVGERTVVLLGVEEPVERPELDALCEERKLVSGSARGS